MNPSKIWILRDWGQFETFRQVNEATKCVPGEGLPGRVLASGNAAWIKNVTKDSNFPQARLAKEIEVKAALRFPSSLDRKWSG